MGKEIRWRRVRSAIVCALLFSLGVPRSLAWGREGHRLTALVAQQYLTAEARAQIAELLHGESIADIASWADEYRNEAPATAPWHFVDIPGSATTFDRNRDCPVAASDPKSPWRDCVTDRILYFEGRLGDSELAPSERAIALKFLVHLIGDIHQPFHAIGDARGGNDIKLTFLGSRQCGTSLCNLHGVWDSELIEHQGLTETAYVARLLGEIQQNQWERFAGGEPTLWANASHHYAVLAEAPNGAMLMSDYVGEESKIVDAELALGGLRLAHVLNRILAAPADAPERKPLTAPHD
jgi:hypothetical protein